ncbi:MAG: DM13 domain-containing protein [Chloroflexota bacterium]|nr:DM13 domain-containing protein [Chloroflexota bacterium]
MRLRALMIGIGALLVIATYTFRLWQPLLDTGIQTAPDSIFPGLPLAFVEIFSILPAEQQAAYRTVAEADPAKGVAMVVAALSPRQAAPEDDEDLPTLIDSVIVAVGSFARIDAVRWGQGEATVYQSSNEPTLLRLDNFSVANGPDLRLAFSTMPQPTTTTEMRAADVDGNNTVFEVGPLKGAYGSQNFSLPTNLNVRQFASLVIYSEALDMIYSIAPLFIGG